MRSGFRVGGWAHGFGVESLCFRVEVYDLGFMVDRSGLRIECFGFRVTFYDLGFRV